MPQIIANGVSLFYDLRGPEAAPVVIFSNSIGATVDMWDPQVAELAGQFRCLRYDTRGHGRSQTTHGPVGIADLAQDMAGLLDALHITSAHVVGMSLGGLTAQMFALRHAWRVRSLTLMATSAMIPSNWDERAARVRELGMASIAEVVMGRWFTSGFLASAPHEVAQVRERFLASSAEGYAVCCGAIRDADLRPLIHAIASPTLLLAGAEDVATPVAMLEDIRSRIGHAELVVISKAAHILTIEQPAVVTRHLRAFLEANSQTGAKPGEGTTFAAGLANRRAVLGAAHVDRSMSQAGPFAAPWQDFITRNAWGEIWGDPALAWKTRSLLVLVMMVALHREEEFKLHLRPALKNGVSLDELRAALLQTAIYAGVPAANAGFRWVKEVLGDELSADAAVQTLEV